MFAEVFIGALSFLVLYAVLIYTYIFPEDSYFAGRRWMYDEAELSEDGIEHIKTIAKFAMIFLTIVLVICVISLFR